MYMTYDFKKHSTLAMYWREGVMLTRSAQAITQGAVPIPPSERKLQTVLSDPWFEASKEGFIFEGAIFVRKGNLRSTSLKLRPDTNGLDWMTSDGATVFYAGTFGNELSQESTK